MKFGEKKKSASPFTKYIEWAAGEKKGYFEYYNGEERVEFKFDEALVVEVCYMIKGYDADKECQIYSNKIEHFGESLTVVSKEGGVIGKGLWKDIKSKVVSIGGKANIVLHCIIDGDLVQISLKGAGFAAITDFLKKFNSEKNLIAYKGAKDQKKGSIKYKTPIMEVGKELTDADTIAGMKAAADLREYENSFKRKNEETEEEIEEEIATDVKTEDMPF